MQDTLIIGAGPAGLTAAIYLARFRRNVTLISAGPSRALLIPETHNFPGFPTGISGAALLARLAEQAANCDVEIQAGRVEALRRVNGHFVATTSLGDISAHKVLLATGVLDNHPDVPRLQEATLAGVVRWCPICDAYEVLDQSVGLLAPARSGLRHAKFLRTYTRDLTLLALPDTEGLTDEEIREQQALGIELVTEPTVSFAPSDDGRQVVVQLAGGGERRFDALYPMHGCDVQAGLATALGGECNDTGDLLADSNQQTSVPGLYAAGDVVSDINQISVAIGHAAIAATSIHNALERNYR